MAGCPVCDAQKNSELILFEDEDIFAYFPLQAISMAHIIITTKKHFQSLDETPDYLVAWCFAIAKKLANILLSSIKIQGLNFLIEEGINQVPHFALNLIPRLENDGLNLNWKPQKGELEELKQVEATIKQATAGKWIFESRPGSSTSESGPETLKNEEGETNYQISQLNRIP